MRSIPTLFRRKNGRVIDEVVFDCKWVTEGRGIPTYKWDGVAVKYQSTIWYKRKVIANVDMEDYRQWLDRPNLGEGPFPRIFRVEQYDQRLREASGWVPAFGSIIEGILIKALRETPFLPPEGTYELIGPGINDNPHDLDDPQIRAHGIPISAEVPTDFEGVRTFLQSLKNAEGIVWHSLNSKAAKINKSDFGIDWP